MLRLNDDGLEAVQVALKKDGYLEGKRPGTPDAHSEQWPASAWTKRLSTDALWASPFTTGRVTNPITRGRIKELACINSDQDLANFITSIFVWGAGIRPWIWPSKLNALIAKCGNTKRLYGLLAAARNLGPVEAYDFMRSDHSRVYGLGPSYGTKFLYFAGYDSRPTQDRPLILDKRVASSIREFCIDGTLLFAPEFNFKWSCRAYGEYIEMANDAAHRIARNVGVPQVETDGIEYALFSLNGGQITTSSSLPVVGAARRWQSH